MVKMFSSASLTRNASNHEEVEVSKMSLVSLARTIFWLNPMETIVLFSDCASKTLFGRHESNLRIIEVSKGQAYPLKSR